MTQELWIVLLAQVAAVTSPGPDFAIVSRNALVHSRSAGLWTSFGVTVGCLIHLSYCLLGLALLITQTPWLFQVLKIAGAAYLIMIGLRAALGTSRGLSSAAQANGSESMSSASAWLQGFLTNLLNPKATLFFLSLFTQVVSPDTSMKMKVLYAGLIFATTFFWFALCSFLLSQARLKKKLEKFHSKIEKVTGWVLVAIGLRIAVL